MSAATENVKVDVVDADSAAGVPKHTKLAHILSILVSGLIALCVASALADGSSVIVLKHEKDLPTVTNPELKNLVTLPKGSHVNLKYNLAELLGPFYVSDFTTISRATFGTRLVPSTTISSTSSMTLVLTPSLPLSPA